MRAPPNPIYESKSGKTSLCLVFTILITGALFIILPLTQLSSIPCSEIEDEASHTYVVPPPPKPPEPPEPPEKKKQLEDPIELDDSLNKVTIRDMDYLLTGVFGDGVHNVIKNINPPTFDGEDISFETFDLDTIPRPISQTAPPYPASLKRAHIEGSVEVVFVVTSTGGVRNIRITSATHREFVDSVRHTLQRWNFEPGKIDNKAVNTRVRQRFDFTVEE